MIMEKENIKKIIIIKVDINKIEKDKFYMDTNAIILE